jgi:ferredoxin-NADP reductase
MMSLLHALVAEGVERPVWFVHGARDGDHHIMANETRELAAGRKNVHLHFAYSRPGDKDKMGRDYDTRGRVTGQLVTDLVTIPDAHYLLCGPTAFMAEIQGALERHRIPAERIHMESFGPNG